MSKTFQKRPNSQHYTYERLKCDVCGSWVETVLDVGGKFGCFLTKKDCTKKLLDSEFHERDKEFVWVRAITDVLFHERKETMKKERNRMTLKLRLKILERDRFTCVLCGNKPPAITVEVDHIVPIHLGGKTDETNLRTLCFKCNHGR